MEDDTDRTGYQRFGGTPWTPTCSQQQEVPGSMSQKTWKTIEQLNEVGQQSGKTAKWHEKSGNTSTKQHIKRGVVTCECTNRYPHHSPLPSHGSQHNTLSWKWHVCSCVHTTEGGGSGTRIASLPYDSRRHQHQYQLVIRLQTEPMLQLSPPYPTKHLLVYQVCSSMVLCEDFNGAVQMLVAQSPCIVTVQHPKRRCEQFSVMWY